MKRISFIILIICFQFVAHSQVINGTIFDKKTNEKVSFASIYFNGTFVGTTSDINGNFTLDVTKNSSMPLSISCMGYNSRTITDFTTDETILIYLEPKFIEMEEIVVSAKSLVRKRKANLKIFKKEFLGTTTNAFSCEIVNEEDIFFNYGADRDTLKAYASKPIIIKNKSLGYIITYYLDKFEYFKESKSFIYDGNIIFNEDLITNDLNRKLYEEKRESAYLGSRMHFLRSLWGNNLTDAGFIIRNSENKDLSYNNIVVQSAGDIQDSLHQYRKFISYPSILNIYYNSTFTTITFLNQRVYFEKTGFHSSGIFWEGEMSTKRIGDTLPYEYVPE